MLPLFAISLLLLAFMVYNMSRWPAVPAAGERLSETVSVLIPARNEESTIAATVERILAGGEPVIEILIYDDHSTDGTAATVAALAERDSRVRLIAPRPLPPDWCGKPFACTQLGEAAQGKWLLFIDADTILGSGAIGRIVAAANRFERTFLSCWPGLEMTGFSEKVFMPMLNFVVFTLFPAPLSVTMNLPALGIAHGACILVRRPEYLLTGGHTMVKDELFEDTALARAWRAAGLRGLCLDGQDVVRVRMYESVAGIWSGFRKNLYPAFRREMSFWVFCIFHFTFFLLPFILVVVQISVGSYSWPAWGMAAAVLLIRALQARRFGYSCWPILLHPLAEGALLALALSSWGHCRLGGGVQWKGRVYRGRTG